MEVDELQCGHLVCLQRWRQRSSVVSTTTWRWSTWPRQPRPSLSRSATSSATSPVPTISSTSGRCLR